MLCYVMLCYVMLCYVMLCYVMLCYVMLCYVMLHPMLCYGMICCVMLRYVMLYCSFVAILCLSIVSDERKTPKQIITLKIAPRYFLPRCIAFCN